MNTAINESKGGIIARMDSDDISHPERFEKCMNVFFQNPEVGVVGTWIIDLPLPESLVFHAYRFQLEGHGRYD